MASSLKLEIMKKKNSGMRDCTRLLSMLNVKSFFKV